MTVFRASVQYGDWRGSSAADDADMFSIRRFAEKQGLIKESEFLIGVKLWLGENHDGNVEEPHIDLLIHERGDYESVAAALAATPDPIKLRKVSVKLTLKDYFSLFKRFSITLSPPNLHIEGREYAEGE